MAFGRCARRGTLTNGGRNVTENNSEIPPGALDFSDRMLPGWAHTISWIFVGLSSLGWLSVAVIAFLLDDLVMRGGDSFMAPILLFGGLVAVALALALEWSHARALAGYRVLRTPVEAMVRTAIAGLVLAVLVVVHPLLGAGIAVGAGLNLLLARFYRRALRRDPMWDFNTREAASFLAGRDMIGFRLAGTRPPGGPSVLRAYRNMASAAAALVALAAGSWLVSVEILNGPAVPAALLMTLWSVESVGAWLVLREAENPLSDMAAASVSEPVQDEDAPPSPAGLFVEALSITTEDGHGVLTDINLSVEPGVMVGVLGNTASGKTTLMRALSDPYELTGLHLRGRVLFNQEDLWDRRHDVRTLPAAFLRREPLLLPASGMDNLSCHGDEVLRERGRRILEQMLFSRELADQILKSEDARALSSGQRKALGIARLFLLNPMLYFMDRPEDGASEALIAALCQRIQVERRAGRTFVIVTGNRALLEMCDQLVVMEEGRIIDTGPADDVRERMTAGWSRLLVERSLDAEDALQSWIRSHFRRDGDEANRRNVSIVSSELLALSVQGKSGTEAEQLSFDFKHQQGHCILRMRDGSSLIGSAQIMKAERDKVTENGKTPPTALARVFRGTSFFEQEEREGDRVITVKIKTYDPRLKKRDGAELTKDGK